MARPSDLYDPAQTAMRAGQVVRIDSPSPDGTVAHYGPGNRLLYRTPAPKKKLSAEEQGAAYEKAQMDFAAGRAGVRGSSPFVGFSQGDTDMAYDAAASGSRRGRLRPSDPNNPDSPLVPDVPAPRAPSPFATATDMSMADRSSTTPSAWSMAREANAQAGRDAGNDRLSAARDAARAGTLDISRTPPPSARLTPEEQARGASVEFKGQGPAGTATVQTKDGRMVTLSGDDMASRDSARAAMAPKPAEPAPSPFVAPPAPRADAAPDAASQAWAESNAGRGGGQPTSEPNFSMPKPTPAAASAPAAPVATTPAGKPIPATMIPVATAAPVSPVSAPAAVAPAQGPFTGLDAVRAANADASKASAEAFKKRVATFGQVTPEEQAASEKARKARQDARRGSVPIPFRDYAGRPVDARIPKSIFTPDLDAGALRTTSPTMQFKMGLKKQNNPSVFSPFVTGERSGARMIA